MHLKLTFHFINPFFPNASFLYPVKTSENRKVSWCFQGEEKECIGNEWVKDPVRHLWSCAFAKIVDRVERAIERWLTQLILSRFNLMLSSPNMNSLMWNSIKCWDNSTSKQALNFDGVVFEILTALYVRSSQLKAVCGH